MQATVLFAGNAYHKPYTTPDRKNTVFNQEVNNYWQYFEKVQIASGEGNVVKFSVSATARDGLLLLDLLDLF